MNYPLKWSQNDDSEFTIEENVFHFTNIFIGCHGVFIFSDL